MKMKINTEKIVDMFYLHDIQINFSLSDDYVRNNLYENRYSRYYLIVMNYEEHLWEQVR